MKKQLLLTACTFVLAIAWVVVANANARFTDAKYKDSAFPTFCFNPITLPPECTLTSPGVVCTSIQNSSTYTYYQGGSCVTPWYKAS